MYRRPPISTRTDTLCPCTALVRSPALPPNPADAQPGNSAPGLSVGPHVVPLPADTPYPGTMALKVDATDVARGIFHVHQTIPVEKAGTLTLLYPEWLPGQHAPRGAISGLTGFQIGRAHVCTPVTNAPLVCRILLE